MEVGLVQSINIDSEMQQSYLDYAMSVIVARALPDARDGLKPVHRRILYAMYDMGLRADSPYKKSARIVGEVLGKYHPHGDMAVYDAMARMAQDFSMRTLLVDGQGNFGSIDGDPPAAMRYTEARLHAPALDMLADINKNTVDFDENFDGTLSEPSVLPAAVPNLLVNGATGIAVGMATSIPPHNLGEVVDALRHMLDNWSKLDDITVEDLMSFIQGPDFPTGGIIIQESAEDGLHSAYGTGRGRITIQARAHLEEMERGKNRIIVTDLPYMTNKASLIERIAELVREEKLTGIVDLRDESDRHGMRIVIELGKTADPEETLRDLYKHTPMQSTFSMIMLALVEGEPRLLNLKQALRVYLEHRLEIIRRRSLFDLEKARQRAHILEGLRVALKNLDEVIDMIRKAPDADTARQRLMKRFKLSEIQAQSILDMQLRRLAALERKKIEEEYKEVVALIKELENLLRSPVKMRQVAGDELLKVKEAYADRRRSQIIYLKEGEPKKSLLTASDLAPDKRVWVTLTTDGLLARSLEDKLPRFSGKDAPILLVRANTRDTLYLVSHQGEAAAIAVQAIPESESPSTGLPFTKVSALKSGPVAVAFAMPPRGGRNKTQEAGEDYFILTVTRNGFIKKSPVSDLPGPSANSFTLVKVNETDRLGWLKMTDGKAEIVLVSSAGMAIRFHESDVRPMGLVAAGVMGIKLQEQDEVIGMDLVSPRGDLLLITSNGIAKRVPLDQFPKQSRYGQGVIAFRPPANTRLSGMAIGRPTDRLILHHSRLAPKAMRFDEAPLANRTARGQVVEELKLSDQIIQICVPWQSPLVTDLVDTFGGENGEKPKKPSLKEVQLALDLGASQPAKSTSKPTRKRPGSDQGGIISPAKKPVTHPPKTVKPASKASQTEPAQAAARKPKQSPTVTGKTTATKTAASKTTTTIPKKSPAATGKTTATKTADRKTTANRPKQSSSATGKTTATKTAVSKKTTNKPAASQPTTGEVSTKKPAVRKPAPAKPSPATSQRTSKTNAGKASKTPATPEKSNDRASQPAKGRAKGN